MQILPSGSLRVIGLYQVRNTCLGHIDSSLTLNRLKLSSNADLCQIIPSCLSRGTSKVGDSIENEVKEKMDLYTLDKVIRLLRPLYTKFDDLFVLNFLYLEKNTVIMGGLVAGDEYKLVYKNDPLSVTIEIW